MTQKQIKLTLAFLDLRTGEMVTDTTWHNTADAMLVYLEERDFERTAPGYLGIRSAVWE